MRRLARHFALALAAALAPPAFASPATEVLSACLVDKTSRQDREDLGRWYVIAISAHPRIKPMMTLGPKERDDADRRIAALFVRLLTVDCPAQMRAAVAAEGPPSLKAAFARLGAASFQELLADPDVQAAMNGTDRYLDRGALEKALRAP